MKFTPRDFRLHELSDSEFERFIVKLCIRWLGQGATGFAPGRDGGRDGKFEGKAECFPSINHPLEGRIVYQAKHVNFSDRSCSDRDFSKLVSGESEKIRRLAEAGLCDHYLLFTNRRVTGGADEKITAKLLKLGPKSVHLIGTERLHVAIEEFPELKAALPNIEDEMPFRFEPSELVEVIQAFHDYADDNKESFDSAHDFEKINIKSEKNRINGLTPQYYDEMIVRGSMVHFSKIEAFLKNPRNHELACLYHDSADDLKEKILLHRQKFENFDNVFAFLSGQIQNLREKLRYKRRLVRILLHYMYFNCDIGSKELEGKVL